METHNARLVNNDGFLRDLQLFCTVARRSSFVTASTEMGISPSHVSKRIALLESALGVKLFMRTTRRVTITSDGEAAFQWAQKILDDVQGMADTFSGLTDEPRGLIRISTSLRLGREHVSPILSLLRKRYAGLEIWLELLERRADLVGENFDIDIRAGTPRCLRDLGQHDCLLFRGRDQRFGVWRLTGPRGEESVKVTGPVASNHSDIVRQWALDGYGVIMASVWDVASSLKSGALVRILPSYSQRADVWAVTSARSSASAKLRVCVDFLKEHLTSGPYALITGGFDDDLR